MNPECWVCFVAVGVGDGLRIKIALRVGQALHRQCHATYAFAESLEMPGERARFRQVLHVDVCIFFGGEWQWRGKLKMLAACSQWERYEHGIPAICVSSKRLRGC